MKHITYQPENVCCKFIDVDIDDNGCICGISFTGGCNGNLKGICSLVRGMKIKDIVQRLNGIRCGMKETSCPDQLCRALDKFSNL